MGGGVPEMLVAAAVSQVARKISDSTGLAQDEAKLLCNFSNDLESIKDTLLYLEEQLKTAEKNSFGSERANLRHWLSQMKSLAYDIEDIVDEYHGSKEQFEEGSCVQKGSLFCSLSNPMLLKAGMAHKMKSKRDMLQTRQSLPTQYHFIPHINSPVNFEEKQTSSYTNDGIKIIGRDKDLENIMGMLMQQNLKELSIIPIVGPVGFGKTSLAQLIFNDATKRGTFELRIWVHVSMGNINLDKIGKGIISQTSERIDRNMQLQSIRNVVQCILNGHRCLIVLDNLWGKDEELNDLKQMLITGRETRSKVIVTTHSERVAELMSTVPPYKLAALSEDDCLTIFSQRAMARRDDPLFKEYGKEIVGRCEGIPLVANFLGSVVKTRRTRRDIWLAARDKEMWKVEEDYPKDTILPIFPSFKLIYYNMPHELRLCFVYCSIFPKGSAIDKKKLIQQWIALDMIDSKHETLPRDVIAEKYIEELKEISFLQVVQRNLIAAESSSAPNELLRMHNLSYDLARSVANNDILVILDDDKKCNTRYCDYRYAQLSASNLQSIDCKAWPLKARSLVFKASELELDHVSQVLLVNKYLRVLDLSGCSIKELPIPIFQLKQLRYLDVSNTPITTLPPKISSFQKLKSLDLSGTEIEVLPSFVSRLKMINYLNLQSCRKLQILTSLDDLVNLKDLNLSFCSKLDILHDSFGNLCSLQFLNLSNCSTLQYLPESFGMLSSLEYLDLSQCIRLRVLPKSFSKLKNLRIKSFGCQDCVVQSCLELTSELHEEIQLQISHTSEQDEIVQDTRLSTTEISEVTCEEPGGASCSYTAKMKYIIEDRLKVPVTSSSQIDADEVEEPEDITKLNTTRGNRCLTHGHQVPCCHSSSFVSSSSAPIMSNSLSEISTSEDPLPNDEITDTTGGAGKSSASFQSGAGDVGEDSRLENSDSHQSSVQPHLAGHYGSSMGEISEGPPIWPVVRDLTGGENRLNTSKRENLRIGSNLSYLKPQLPATSLSNAHKGEGPEDSAEILQGEQGSQVRLSNQVQVI